jgi:regulation of enolase protein 1 (concanavalin A-like superfamily)
MMSQIHGSRWCFALLLAMLPALVVARDTPELPALPGALTWKNAPLSWHYDPRAGLQIAAGPKTDWFVDPFDGTLARNAPILLFTPGRDYVLTSRVTARFSTKWDAGALMLMGDDHHWAKLSYEYSPDGKPTLVTVVTRGLSDDSNSVSVPGDSVYLRITRSDKTYVFYFSTDGQHWQNLRTFSLDTDLTMQVGFEAQSPAGKGASATFTSISYEARHTGNTYK